MNLLSVISDAFPFFSSFHPFIHLPIHSLPPNSPQAITDTKTAVGMEATELVVSVLSKNKQSIEQRMIKTTSVVRTCLSSFILYLFFEFYLDPPFPSIFLFFWGKRTVGLKQWSVMHGVKLMFFAFKLFTPRFDLISVTVCN